MFRNSSLILLLLSIIISPKLYSQIHWESIILETDTWRYIIPNEPPSEEWTKQLFDSRNWNSGQGGFGYADDDDNTVVPTGTTSIYIHKEFNLTNADDVSDLVLDIDYDDAFVAYLNGVEVARSSNLETGNLGVAPFVSTDHEAVMYSGGTPERFRIDTDLLVSGYNALAVQIINHNNTSSDLSGRVFLSGRFDGPIYVFNPTPDWFEAPTEVFTSTLPIILINTEGQPIPDEPKIMATMQVIDNEDRINYFDPSRNDSLVYDGSIGIELRGNTALGMAKKSYTVETRNADSTNNNVNLFGMGKENDWVLHGPYADKTMMRNALAYHIGNNMGRWNPSNQFVEVQINDEYQGVYLFVEKIKIDDDRVDIAILKETDVEGDQVTGGYIMSIDRENEGSWNSQYMGRTGTYETTFSFVDPKSDELNLPQQEYIKAYIDSFETALIGENFKDEEVGYRNFINVQSFVDYFIISELSKDIDAYRVSFFFHKDKDSKGGKLTASPFWDYNLCFGNANFYGGDITTGWTSDPKPFGIGEGDQGNEIPFWWDRFREDPYWETVLKYRWEDLRNGVLADDSFNAFIDSCYNELKTPSERNFDKWNVLNTYIWPNVFRYGTYEEHVNFMRNWVLERMEWIDGQIELITPTFVRNTPPIADAGADFTINENTLVTITGSGFDEDGDELTYQWEGPNEIFFENANLAETRIIAPSIPKDTVFTLILTVSDGTTTDSNKVKVSVIDNSSTNNHVPTANAGADISISENSIETITGSGSDVDGDELTYRWKGPSEIFFGDANNAETTIIVPSVSADTTFTITLTVSDGILEASDAIEVTVLNNVASTIAELNNMVKVYPNPASEQFTIQFYNETAQANSIIISTITGQKVYQSSKYNNQGSNKLSITKHQLNTNSKILFYQVSFEKRPSVVGKLILNK